jgi:Gluconate 2-dehydrogenase subunit 3
VTKDERLHLIGDGQTLGRALTRRQMVQRMLAGMGAGMAWPLVAASHPIHRLLSDDAIFSGADAQMASADWKPLFLNAPQNEALVALSEIIVPGSAKAQVNRFIDLLLSVDAPANQKNFSASISAMDDVSQKRFGHPFAALRGDQQNELLTAVSKKDVGDSESKDKGSEARNSEDKLAAETRPSLNDHFNNLKGWISGAYYSSETGMTELGWTGEYAFENYPSCQHAEEHH